MDAVVEGEILAYNVLPVGLHDQRRAASSPPRSPAATPRPSSPSVVYRKIGQTEPLWENESFSQRDEYDMGETRQGYFDREEQSIERLSQRFARSLVAAMLEAF